MKLNENFRCRLGTGVLDDEEVELQLSDKEPVALGQELFNVPGKQAGVINFSNLFSKAQRDGGVLWDTSDPSAPAMLVEF